MECQEGRVSALTLPPSWVTLLQVTHLPWGSKGKPTLLGAAGREEIPVWQLLVQPAKGLQTSVSSTTK